MGFCGETIVRKGAAKMEEIKVISGVEAPSLSRALTARVVWMRNSTTMTAVRRAPGRVRRFFADLGPGLITGAADDDPSGISTYSVTGAAFGYSQLWTALFSFPLMFAV